MFTAEIVMLDEVMRNASEHVYYALTPITPDTTLRELKGAERIVKVDWTSVERVDKGAVVDADKTPWDY